MVEYTCERCLCSFNKKSNYMRHQNRKKQCSKVIIQDSESNNTDLLLNKIKDMEQKMKDMEKDTINMKKIIDRQNKTITKYEKCNIDNSTNNIDNSTNVINVIAFGKEDLSFITDANYKQIMNRGYAAPCILTEHIHYNKDRPENHNIYVSNKKDKKYIHVFDGNKWNVRLTKDIIEELKLNASELIKSKIDLLDPNNKQEANILKKIKRFIESYEKDDKNLNDFDKNYELMFYNNRDMVKNTHSMQIHNNI